MRELSPGARDCLVFLYTFYLPLCISLFWYFTVAKRGKWQVHVKYKCQAAAPIMPHGELIVSYCGPKGFQQSLVHPDPDLWSCAFSTPGSGIRIWEPGWKKVLIRDPEYDPRPLETNIGLKILEFFYAGSGSGIFLILDPWWKNLDPGSRMNIPDPQHWFSGTGVRISKTLVQLEGGGEFIEGRHNVLGNTDGIVA